MYNFILKEPLVEEFEDHADYGELYYIGGSVENFAHELPPAIRKFRFSEKHTDINQADILIFGDSQLDFSRQTTLPERVADSTKSGVFYYRFNKPYDGNAIAYMRDHYRNQKDSVRRLFIYQSAERYVAQRAEAGYEPVTYKNKRNPVVELAVNFKDKIFNFNTEYLYRSALQRSYLTSWIDKKISTLKFNAFSYISSKIKSYEAADSPEDSWLFVDESVNQYNREFTDEQLEGFAKNIKKMQDYVSEEYNMDFIYFIVPESYTVYREMKGYANKNRFIERMQTELEKYGVNYINLYDDFIKQDKALYYKTDTHWNEEGVDIAVDKLLDFITNDLKSN